MLATSHWSSSVVDVSGGWGLLSLKMPAMTARPSPASACSLAELHATEPARQLADDRISSEQMVAGCLQRIERSETDAETVDA